MPIIACERCQTTYYVRSCRITEGRERFCSQACANAAKQRPLVDRFWEKVQRGEPEACWLWLGHTMRSGYGNFGTIGKQKEGAHRVSYRLAYGEILDGLCVLHRCDNRLCVHPAHLFLGTLADNVHDAQAKGRMRSGETHPHARLTEQDVTEIRVHLENRLPQHKIAAMYGVSQATISLIKQKRNWKHV